MLIDEAGAGVFVDMVDVGLYRGLVVGANAGIVVGAGGVVGSGCGGVVVGAAAGCSAAVGVGVVTSLLALASMVLTLSAEQSKVGKGGSWWPPPHSR